MSFSPGIPEPDDDRHDDIRPDSAASLMEPTASIRSRVFGIVLAFIVGVAFATIGTVVHQETIAGMPLPLVLALIGVIALLIGFRMLLDDRLVVLAAGVGIVLPILLFSFVSPGGSALIQANLLGLAWTLAPVLIATVVVSWPRLPARVLRRETGSGHPLAVPGDAPESQPGERPSPEA